MSSGFREKYSLPRAVARTLLFQILSRPLRLFFLLRLLNEDIGLRLLFFMSFGEGNAFCIAWDG